MALRFEDYTFHASGHRVENCSSKYSFFNNERDGAIFLFNFLHFSYMFSCLFQKLVVKPDQLIKRRGKLGLIKVNATLAEVKEWLSSRLAKEIKVGGIWNFFFSSLFQPYCC